MGSSVGIVDTRRGNLFSVRSALEHLGADAVICAAPEELADHDRIVLPGVGAFRDAMHDLETRGFVDALHAFRATGRPVIGLCLGMQLLGRRSEEGGPIAGLGWIEGDVVKLDGPGLRVPHTGWNEVHGTGPLFDGIPDGSDFYFVHSYHLVPDDDAIVDATCDHGGPVIASVRDGNVAGMQFHPEKSQDHGLHLLENFLAWSP